jgi:hypothetical protein
MLDLDAVHQDRERVEHFELDLNACQPKIDLWKAVRIGKLGRVGTCDACAIGDGAACSNQAFFSDRTHR